MAEPRFTPVENDPFALGPANPVPEGMKLTPVEGDPFARAPGALGKLEGGADQVVGAAQSGFNSFGRGVAQAGVEANRWLGMGLAGAGALADWMQTAATGTPHTEGQDVAFEHFVAPSDRTMQGMDQAQAEDNRLHPVASQIAHAGGHMATDIGMMVATDGATEVPTLTSESASALTQGATMAGNALSRSSAASALPATVQGLQTGEQTFEDTGDPLRSVAAGLTEAGTTTLANALPVGMDGPLIKRALAGAAAGAVGGEAQRTLHNEVASRQAPFSWGDVGMNALFGSTLGAVMHGAAHENPEVVTQRYNDLARAAEGGDAVAAKTASLVNDLTAVDGLSGAALDAAGAGVAAGEAVHAADHAALLSSTPRYRQIAEAAADLPPAEAEGYAKAVYAQEVATNSAWDAYLQATKLSRGRQVQGRLAGEIKQALQVGEQLVPPLEMNKLMRWAFLQPRGQLALRDALAQTTTARKVPDYVEEAVGKDFEPDGALSAEAFAKDAHPDAVTVRYPDDPAIGAVLKANKLVPYRVDGALVVHGLPEAVDRVAQVVADQTGLTPLTGDEHGEANLHAQAQGEQGSGPAEGTQGGHDAAARPAAEAGQSAEALGLDQGQAEVGHISTAERAQPVVDALAERGVVHPVNREGVITLHPGVGEQAARHALDVAAEDTYTEPTPAQAAAGNYRKGGVLFKSPKGDLKVRIETPDGAVRRGDWGSRTIRGAHYGYLPGTRAADGDPIDVLLTRHAHDDSRPVAVINQHDRDGLHDEIKVVLGANNRPEALQTYAKQYPPGMLDSLLPKGTRNITMMSREKFMRYLQSGQTDVPPHPVSGMPMAHLRREVRRVPEENPVRIGRARQAGEGQEPAPAGEQQPARVLRRDEVRPAAAYQGLKVRTEAPLYQHGQGAKPVSAVAVHYSPKAGLTHLDPRMAGTGSAGGERYRHGSGLGNGDPLTSMVHFYVRTGEHLPTKESVVQGGHAYEVRLNNLYDVKADPEGILADLEAKGYGANRDLALEEIHDAGYDGWIAPSLPGMPEGHVASVFGDAKVPVKAVDQPVAHLDREPAARHTPETNTGSFGSAIGRKLAEIMGVKEGSEGEVVDQPAFNRAVAAYNRIPDAHDGQVMAVDVARELSPEYLADRTKSADTHEASGAFIKALYRERLAQPTPPDREPLVVFTAGGTGAGKTTAVEGSPGLKFADIVYDTNMNGYASSLKKIEQALDSGRRVKIMYVYRDPADAMRHGALKRSEGQIKKYGTGRTVPVSAHVDTHVGALRTMRELAEHFKDDPRVEISVFDNSFGRGNARRSSLAELQDLQYDDVTAQSTREVEEAYQHGEISAATYRGFLGKEPPQRAGESAARGEVRQGQVQGDGSGLSGRPEPGRESAPADQVSQFSWEAVPSTALPGFDWLHHADPAFRADYTRTIHETIGPAILEEFGIDHAGVTLGYGGWEGRTNASVQEHVAWSPAMQGQLAKAAATYGLLLKQDGVAYHHPDYAATPKEANGVHIEAGRPLSAAETEALYARVSALAEERFGLSETEAQAFAPIPTATGVRFLNFHDGVGNRAFHKLIDDAASAALPDDLSVTTHAFKSEGDLIGNDWETHPHGEGYQQRLVETGGWDSARRTLDRLGPKVEAITRQFRQRARDGEAGQAAADQAHTEDATEAAQARRVDHAALAVHVERFAETFKGRSAFDVRRNVAELPPDHPVRRWAAAMGFPEDLGGVFYNGRMYLFSDAIRDTAEAELITLHEMVGHGGMRAVFGDDYEGFLDEIVPTVKNTALFQEVAARYRRANPAISDARVADEYLAALAETADTADARPVWSRLLAATKNWLRSHGFKRIKWSEDDLKSLVRATYRGVRDGRISLKGLEPPSVTFDDEHHLATATYVGAHGQRGFVDHFADGSRELRVGGLDASGLRRVERDGADYLDVAGSLDFTEPHELLHLTRFAGEEALDGVLLDKGAVDAPTLEASGIPHEDVGDAWRLPASQGQHVPMFSLRNRAVGTPTQEAILKKTIAHSQYNMNWGDRMQQMLRDLRDRIMSGDSALNLKQSYVDALASVGRYERRMNGGLLLDASESAYKSAWMAKNTEQILAGVMKLGVPEFKAGSFSPVAGRKGLMEIFAPLYRTQDGKSLDMLWEGYAYARRANELIAQSNRDGTPREKLLDQSEIDELLKLEQQHPEFKQVMDDYQAFNHQLLDLAVDRGALSREMADLWMQNTYVPFYRAFEEDTENTGFIRGNKGIQGKRVTSARLHGSDQSAQPIIENIIKNTGTILDKVYANEAMRRVVALTNDVGMERVRFPFSPVSLSLGEIEKTLEKIGLHVGGKAAGRYTHFVPQAQMDQLVQFFRMAKPVGHDIVSVMEGGRPVYYKVTDPMLLRSVTAFTDIHQFDHVMGAILGVPAKILRTAVTLDPRFIYRNLLRDTVTSWAQSGYNPNVFRHMASSAKEVYTDGDFLNALRVAGYNGNEYFRVNELREHLQEMHGGQRVTVLNSPKRLYRAYHKIGFISEQLNRIALARKVVEQGGSLAEAAWQAQNTLNFQMRGDSRAMQLLIRAVPFLNARVQGLARLYDGMLGRDVDAGRKAAVMAFLMKSAVLAAAGAALDAWNWDDKRYDRIPEASKDTYYHFFIGNQHYMLPKPFELGALTGTLPERVMRVIAGKDNKRTFAEAMKRMAVNTFQFTAIPQTLQPILEDYANKDSFTGVPIVSMAEQNQLPGGQYDAMTSPAAVKLAHAMPAVAPDLLRSPDRLEHLYKGYTGTMGAYLLMMADATLRTTGQAPAGPESRWGNQAAGAVLGTFGLGDATTDPRTKYLAQYYDAQRMADEAAASVRKYVKEGHLEDAREAMADNATPLAYRTTLRQVGKQMKALRQAEIAIYQSRALSPEEKRARLTTIQQTRVKLLDQVGPMLELVTDFH